MRKQFPHALAGVCSAQRAPPATFFRKISAFSNQFPAEKLKDQRQKRAESVPKPSAAISRHSTKHN